MRMHIHVHVHNVHVHVHLTSTFLQFYWIHSHIHAHMHTHAHNFVVVASLSFSGPRNSDCTYKNCDSGHDPPILNFRRGRVSDLGLFRVGFKPVGFKVNPTP